MKLLAALFGCIGSVLVLFSGVPPVMAGAKPAAQKALTTQQLARLALPSVVRLTVLDAQGVASVQGSGFVVGKNMIATNVHVISGAHAVTANFQNGRSEVVKGLVSADVPRDLALVYADTAGVRPLVFATTPAQVGDPVMAVGSPEGLGGSISTGVISGMRSYDRSKVIQTTAPISPGSSGGALLDVHGQVLGITSFFYKDGQNLNFAYVSDYLRRIRPYRAASVHTWRQIEEGYKPAPRVATGEPQLAIPPSLAPASTASEDTYMDKPLAGLGGFIVVISDIDKDAQREGLDAGQLKVEVELKLRKDGIAVFESMGTGGKSNAAWLHIDIDTLKKADGSYIYSVNTRVADVVRLIRAMSPYTTATIWTTGNYGYTTSLSERVHQYAGDGVDRLANDYLAQNPK